MSACGLVLCVYPKYKRRKAWADRFGLDFLLSRETRRHPVRNRREIKRATGGGAGRSWALGVMEVQTFEALGGGLEHIDRVPVSFGGVDRPEGSIGPGTKVLGARFAAFSLPERPRPAD